MNLFSTCACIRWILQSIIVRHYSNFKQESEYNGERSADKRSMIYLKRLIG